MGKPRNQVKKPIYKGSKAAVQIASPSLVSLITREVPVNMTTWRSNSIEAVEENEEYGIILECKVDGDGYSSTILAAAKLFKWPNGIQPRQLKCYVFVSDGKLYKGKLLTCDFHYNLALIRIRSGSRLQPATLRGLSDVSSINIKDYEDHQSDGEKHLRLRRHTNLFKVQSGTRIIILNCSFSPPFSVDAACSVFCAHHNFQYHCKELYWVDCPGMDKEKRSGAVINLSGEVVGIMLDYSAFLPSNFISRWWNHYKSKRVCRPWVGVEVANLAQAHLSFLDQLKSTFSDIGTGVIVTKVENDTPAYRSGIRLKDVIIECGCKRVRSKIEFFEQMWDNAGKSVALSILRASDGQPLHLSMSIEETPETNYYQWLC